MDDIHICEEYSSDCDINRKQCAHRIKHKKDKNTRCLGGYCSLKGISVRCISYKKWKEKRNPINKDFNELLKEI